MDNVPRDSLKELLVAWVDMREEVARHHELPWTRDIQSYLKEDTVLENGKLHDTQKYV